MSLLQNIYDWSTSLEPWQSDAVRRLVHKQTLDTQDYEDLYALLKSSRGLPDPQKRRPQPLSAADLPAAASQGVPITLIAMKDLENVNRIVGNQVLKFAPNGVTVVYGDNGSGKSGYSRVLKRACRARDQDENVLPNQFLPTNQQGTPEAAFEVEVSGTRKTLKWANSQAAPDDLAAISVFDSRCARAYLDAEQDVAHMPYGLDVVETLGNTVLPKLSERLNQELVACTVDRAAFQDLAGPTAVGEVIAALSATTDPTLVESLAAVSDTDQQTHLALGKTLREEEPKSKAQSLRRTQQRVTAVLNRANAAILAVGDDALRRLQTIDQETAIAIAAQRLAASQFQAGESLLPGTGGPEWQALFDAARKFSAIAYPGEVFPVPPRAERVEHAHSPPPWDPRPGAPPPSPRIRASIVHRDGHQTTPGRLAPNRTSRCLPLPPRVRSPYDCPNFIDFFWPGETFLRPSSARFEEAVPSAGPDLSHCRTLFPAEGGYFVQRRMLPRDLEGNPRAQIPTVPYSRAARG
jgi:hypothetical protein